NAAFFARERRDTESEPERLLAGNVLAAAKAPGFAAELLRETLLTVQVRLAGPWREDACGGPRLEGDREDLKVPRGMPPTPAFVWSTASGEGALPLPGRNTILWLRRVPVRRWERVECESRVWDPGLVRLGWLADELGVSVHELDLASVTCVDLEPAAAATLV